MAVVDKNNSGEIDFTGIIDFSVNSNRICYGNNKQGKDVVQE